MSSVIECGPCLTCRFSTRVILVGESDEYNEKLRRCVRHPPPVGESTSVPGRQPLVYTSDGCYEYEYDKFGENKL